LIGDVLKSLHARIAQELSAADEDAGKVGELAYHWAAAGDDARAIEYNERAGDRALELSACRDAVRFYRKTLEFAYPPGWARAKLYEKLAIALQSEGVSEEPMIWLTAAIAEYRKVGDLVSVASALLAVALQSWFDAKTEEFTAATQEAIDLLDSVDAPNLLSRARITHARFAITLARIDEAEESLRLARPREGALDASLETEFFEVRGEIHGARGDATAALADLERAARLADRLGSADALMRIENSLAITACDVGDIEAATVAHERALALTTRWALTWRTAYIKVNAAYTAFLAGDLGRAQTLLVEALASGVDNSTVRVRAAGVGILIGLSMKDEDLVEQLADRKALDEASLTGEPQRYGLVSAAWSMLLRERGESDEAREIVGRAIGKLPRFHRCWPLAAEVVAVGDDLALRRALDLLAAQAESGHAVAKVFLLLARAEAARRSNDRVEAQALARRAAQGFRALRWPIFEAIACEHAGDVDEALAINLRIGNRRDVAKQRGRLRWKGPVDKTDLPAPMLTPRQREIAELIGEGHTNKMIAQRLGISEGTVEKHLVTAFEKIGVRSRAQLVTYLANTRRAPA
jgi:DNA-binding CsgD family transcriptional regulator/Flp pilus assembly protein TadD